MARIKLIRLAPLLALAMLFCLSTCAWAAEGAGGKEATASNQWGGVVLSVGTIIVFIALLIILRWKAWGPIMEGLEKREQTLHGAHTEAKKLREEAAQLRLD